MKLISLLNALPASVAQGLIWAVMAIGVYITYKILDFADLTVDGSIATGGAVTVMMILSGANPYVALLCAFVVGMAAGLITGLFHTALGIPPILSGILTQIALYSINMRILDGKSNQAASVDKYDLIISSRYINHAILVGAIFVVVLIAILYWFFGTELGHSLRATGNNPNMARAQGININFNKMLALVLSNGLVALSGGLLSQYQGYADVKMGQGAIVIGLAAVIIGDVLFGRIFRNFAFKLLGVGLGAVIYYVVIAVVLWLRLPSNDLKLFTSLLVAVFLAFPRIKELVQSKMRYHTQHNQDGGQ